MGSSLPTKEPKLFKVIVDVKQMLVLDDNNPDCHRCLLKFFHKISNLAAPVTSSEKLCVLDAEHLNIRQLHGKLTEVNNTLLAENKDSLRHRAAAAEMLHVLEPGKKAEAIKIIEDSTNNLAQRIETC